MKKNKKKEIDCIIIRYIQAYIQSCTDRGHPLRLIERHLRLPTDPPFHYRPQAFLKDPMICL